MTALAPLKLGLRDRSQFATRGGCLRVSVDWFTRGGSLWTFRSTHVASHDLVRQESPSFALKANCVDWCILRDVSRIFAGSSGCWWPTTCAYGKLECMAKRNLDRASTVARNNIARTGVHIH